MPMISCPRCGSTHPPGQCPNDQNDDDGKRREVGT